MKLKFLKNSIEKNIDVHNKIIKLHREIKIASIKIFNTLKKKKKIFICGNGGSAGDAQHLAAELIVRLRSQKNRKALPAITLALDTSTLTACANDFGFDRIFERTLESIGLENDILLVISTSGNSKNIIETLKLANERGIYALGFLGGNGGEALQYCDSAFIVSDKVTARIQESHITAGHALLQYVEDKLLQNGWLTLDK